MLSINISELVLTVLSFFVLLFVLDRLLYRPIMNFMEQRQNRIEQGLDLQRELKAQKEALGQEVFNRISDSEKHAEELRERIDTDIRQANARMEAQMKEQDQQSLIEAEAEAVRLNLDGQELLNAHNQRLAKALADRLSQE